MFFGYFAVAALIHDALTTIAFHFQNYCVLKRLRFIVFTLFHLMHC